MSTINRTTEITNWEELEKQNVVILVDPRNNIEMNAINLGTSNNYIYLEEENHEYQVIFYRDDFEDGLDFKIYKQDEYYSGVKSLHLQQPELNTDDYTKVTEWNELFDIWTVENLLFVDQRVNFIGKVKASEINDTCIVLDGNEAHNCEYSITINADSWSSELHEQIHFYVPIKKGH